MEVSEQLKLFSAAAIGAHISDEVDLGNDFLRRAGALAGSLDIERANNVETALAYAVYGASLWDIDHYQCQMNIKHAKDILDRAPESDLKNLTSTYHLFAAAHIWPIYVRLMIVFVVIVSMEREYHGKMRCVCSQRRGQTHVMQC